MDESRKSLQSKIWSTNLAFNPPSLWITINPSDTYDPIAQVLAGANIDLDHFLNSAGPLAKDQGQNMASDPFAATEYFHLIITVILEELFGIKAAMTGASVCRKDGIFGQVNAYIGAVESQGRGTLHLHILLWLRGSPSSKVMMAALLSEAFRDKMKEFIRANITADLDSASAEEIDKMSTQTAVSYARPMHPSEPDYQACRNESLKSVARTVQYHKCKPGMCVKKNKEGKPICKRRVPVPMSSDAWVLPTSEWGPKQMSANMVAWCPDLMNCIKSNQDVKLITNAVNTKDITWYITNYATKKQLLTWNTSAMLARTLAFEMEIDQKVMECHDLGKKLVQKFAHAMNKEQEFSVCEAISHIMGWGDRFLFHHYVTVYWNVVMAAIQDAYPQLREKR